MSITRESKRTVLLVGLELPVQRRHVVNVETRGLCRPEIEPLKSASPLYDYDLVIINPQSYSHFIFGRAGNHSHSDKELWDLKRENNNYDLDSAFDRWERLEEFKAALARGSQVVWVMTADKKSHFFGWRSLYQAYLSQSVESLAERATFFTKRSKSLIIDRPTHILAPYFEQVRKDGWTLCGTFPEDHDYVTLASTPDGKKLGLEIAVEGSRGWMVTPPNSETALSLLINLLLQGSRQTSGRRFHGIFLSHTSADKPFVRKLKKALNKRGVADVWIDEAEIIVGDSLIDKIQEGLTKTKFFGVVLSPRSVQSNWVRKELEAAMSREMESGSLVVLPLLYEECDLPPFLKGRLYADFTSPKKFSQSLEKLLRRLVSTPT